MTTYLALSPPYAEEDLEALRAAKARRPPNAVHAAADAHVAKMSVAVRYAFAMGRKAIAGTKMTAENASRIADKAAAAVHDALIDVLPGTLAQVLKAGGDAGLGILAKKLRIAGGVGSGNFGHAGRPGEVGGSGSTYATSEQVSDANDPDGVHSAPILTVPIGSVIPDEDMATHPRPEVVARYKADMQAGAPVPAIIVDTNRNVLDGHHKLAAARELGLTHIPVRVNTGERLKALGGTGSGNFGHAGRPGEVGGSSSDPMAGERTEGTKQSAEARLREVVKGYVSVSSDHSSVVAAGRIASTLQDLKARGYKIPKNVEVATYGVESNFHAVTDYDDRGPGSHTFTVVIPRETDKSVDDLVRSEMSHTASRTLDDVVIHEVGHLNADRHASGVNQDVASKVSKYATTNTREFVAETFTRLIRGDTLPDDVMGLYKSLGGPKTKAQRGAEMRVLAPQVKGQPHGTIGPGRMSFNATDPNAVAWIKKHALELAKGLSDTSKQNIRDALVRAFEEGDRDQLEDDVMAAVGDQDRADLIAHHETMVASNEGQREGWDQAVDEGLLNGNEQVEWIATSDQHVCDECEALDGQVRDLDGVYPDPGEDGPPLHVQCRCTEGLSIPDIRGAEEAGHPFHGNQWTDTVDTIHNKEGVAFKIIKNVDEDAGTIEYAIHDGGGNRVGSALIEPDHRQVVVDEAHRRQGLASALYNYIEKDRGEKFKPEKLLTKEGAAFWKGRHLGGPGSGNFGHAGRPGEVGGSASGLVDEWGKPLNAAAAEAKRIRMVTDRAESVARGMEFDLSRIHVVDKEPTPFVVGNHQFKEAGHFDPVTGQIEINARNSYDDRMSVTNGIVCHEVMHAEYDAVVKAQDEEHVAMAADISAQEYGHGPSPYSSPYFDNDGRVRPGKLDEVKERFPASAAFAETMGDAYLGDLGRSRGVTVQSMIDEDGHSAYAKVYWEVAKTTGEDRERAIRETLAEAARFLDHPASWHEAGEPSPKSPWVKLARDIQAAYKKVKR